MNSTDLHIEYKMDTGKTPHGKRKDSEPHRYQKDYSYNSLYAEWLEKKLLEILNKQSNN